MTLDDFPGYAEAVAFEARVRAEAFLNVPRVLCALPAVPLSLYRRGLLRLAGNPFICGGPVTLAAVAQFLWHVSPDFQAHDAKACERFLKELLDRVGCRDLAPYVREIGAFVEEMEMDAPAGSGGSRTPAWGTEASYVGLLAVATGWDDAKIMHLPLPALYSLVRVISKERDPDAVFFNKRSDKVRRAWSQAQSNPPPAAEQAAGA